jgi:hypothetical protein
MPLARGYGSSNEKKTLPHPPTSPRENASTILTTTPNTMRQILIRKRFERQLWLLIKAITCNKTISTRLYGTSPISAALVTANFLSA